MNADTAWQTVTRVLAVAGFVIVSVATLKGLAVPWGFYVLLVGLFFGPDVYEHFGPGEGK